MLFHHLLGTLGNICQQFLWQKLEHQWNGGDLWPPQRVRNGQLRRSAESEQGFQRLSEVRCLPLPHLRRHQCLSHQLLVGNLAGMPVVPGIGGAPGKLAEEQRKLTRRGSATRAASCLRDLYPNSPPPNTTASILRTTDGRRSGPGAASIDCRTLGGFRTSRDGLRRAKLACAHAMRFRSSSTGVHSGPATRAAQPRGEGRGGPSLVGASLPPARLVARLTEANLNQ
jgi:hypothetical protein